MTIWSVYLLVSGPITYVGATTDPVRRLRQHNGEIRGGARATHGRKWSLVMYVTGFTTKSECYRWEKLTKGRARGLMKRGQFLHAIVAGQCPPGRKGTKNYPVPENLICVQFIY